MSRRIALDTGSLAAPACSANTWLADNDAALLLADRDVEYLGAEIDALRSDPARRAAMGDNARAMGEVHRSGALSALIERVAAP
jgi:UDP-N-acetylglucosamine:LPS N-acetylglucosamine transferase